MRFDYTGYHGCQSHCDIEVFRGPGKVMVLCTEAEDNKGTSVTNMAEHIATDVCRRNNIAHTELVWIEHYPGPRTFGSGYDLVIFKRKGDRLVYPDWRPLTVAAYLRLREEVQGCRLN